MLSQPSASPQHHPFLVCLGASNFQPFRRHLLQTLLFDQGTTVATPHQPEPGAFRSGPARCSATPRSLLVSDPLLTSARTERTEGTGWFQGDIWDLQREETAQMLPAAECSEMQARASLANVIVMATVLWLLRESSNSALDVIPYIWFVVQYCSPSSMLKTHELFFCYHTKDRGGSPTLLFQPLHP